MKDSTKAPSQIGDRSTSDVVVRLRTQEGRDDWFYCHSHVLTEKCKYFADRLSEDWPTCQILDSRNCVEVHCQESEFDHHVSALRLLYVNNESLPDTWHGVRNALGILRVAIQLGCQHMAHACVEYLEAVPWEEAEEEEILRIIPGLGSQAEPILARLRPVNPIAVVGIFLSAIRFATSSPPPSMNELKTSAQEQLEYMLTEDDDAPLLTADEGIKSDVKKCMSSLRTRFCSELESMLCGSTESESKAGETKVLLLSLLSDLAWACQILGKLEMMKEFVHSWVEMSDNILKAIDGACPSADMLETKLRVIEVTVKVLEAIGYGNVIIPTARRLHMVKVWLPFVRRTRHLLDRVGCDGEDCLPFKMDSEVWQSMESAFVSMVLALPSGDQAQILADWLSGEHAQYPDLTEAFEVWCYRSKIAKRRMTFLGGGKNGVTHG